MKRESAKRFVIDANLRCDRIYRTENTARQISELKTVGFKLNKAQALQLARVLLAVTQEWDEIDLTDWRFNKRASDDTYIITVTRPVCGELLLIARLKNLSTHKRSAQKHNAEPKAAG